MGIYNTLFYMTRKVCTLGGVVFDWPLFPSRSMFTSLQGNRAMVCFACHLSLLIENWNRIEKIVILYETLLLKE